jgi:hypothetical protein
VDKQVTFLALIYPETTLALLDVGFPLDQLADGPAHWPTHVIDHCTVSGHSIAPFCIAYVKEVPNGSKLIRIAKFGQVAKIQVSYRGTYYKTAALMPPK